MVIRVCVIFMFNLLMRSSVISVRGNRTMQQNSTSPIANDDIEDIEDRNPSTLQYEFIEDPVPASTTTTETTTTKTTTTTLAPWTTDPRNISMVFLILIAIAAVTIVTGIGLAYWRFKTRNHDERNPLTDTNDCLARVPQTAEADKTDTSTNDAVYEYVDHSACGNPVHQTLQVHRTDTSTNDAVYEYVDYSACGDPGLTSSSDIAHRPPYPLPPQQKEEPGKYVHYATVYEERLDRIMFMHQIRRNLRR